MICVFNNSAGLPACCPFSIIVTPSQSSSSLAAVAVRNQRPTTPYSEQSDSCLLRDDQAGREEGSCEAQRELPERAQPQRGHRHEALWGSSLRRWGVAHLVIYVMIVRLSAVMIVI